MGMHSTCRTALGAALIALAALTQVAAAQSFEIVPPANATTAGDTANRIPIGSGGGGTYQMLYPASQLVGVPIGGQITSIQLRLVNSNAANWPAAASSITSYEIKMGGSTKTTATLSTTFADNITNPVVVRSGALNLAAGAYPAGAATGTTPEGWGPVITFSTPYTYTGGPLVIEFRNTGTSTVVFGDAVLNTDLGRAVGNIASNAETIGGFTFALVARLGVTPPNAQSVTLPNANDTVAGFSGNYIPFAASTGGRHMTLYAADQLAEIPAGSVIVGLQLRQRNAEITPWPASAFTSSDYEIWLCRSALTPATVSGTFADNILDPVRVRDGARDFAQDEFPGGPASGTTPEAWGPLIAFDTPYVYTGGVLGLEFRTTGGGPSPNHFADIVANGATAAGLASTTSPTNPTGSLNSAIIARFTYVPPVESPFGHGVTKIYALKQFADTPASTFQAVLTQNVDRTAQFLFGPEQFQTVGPGTLLTGVAFRNSSTTSWPPAFASFPQFDVRLSRSPLTPDTMSTTVASNSGTDATTVRSGSLDVAAGTLVAKPLTGTAPFTWEVPFTQAYTYRSGTLDMLVNRQAIPGGDGRLEALPASDTALQLFARGKFSAGNVAATVATSGNVPVSRYSADAQVICPNALKDGSGFINSSPLPFQSGDTAFQQIIAASELSYVPIGGVITSISFINSSETDWPGITGASADDYAVEISTATNRPATMSTTFAQNVGSDALIVRSGPISWLPGALPSASTGRYGGTITFDRGFVYSGGDLCITVRHSGVSSSASASSGGLPSNNRCVFNNDSKVATTGSFFVISNAGFAVQLGYIPSGVSPKNVLAAEGFGGRAAFAGNRAYQMIFDANQVGVPVGATINGVSFRLDGAASAFPTADLTLDRFDITMSSATNSAATMSDTFASNEGADVTTVRSGPITIPASSYPPTADGGRGFGLFIPFTRPFVYKGGPITMLLRNGNASGANPSFNVDAHSVGANGKRDTSSADAVSGTSVLNALVARFAFTDDAFCPWDLNNDGVVDDDDFQVFVLSYNILDCADAAMPLGCPSDFTFDRIVNDDDFLPFVQAYNAVLCP